MIGGICPSSPIIGATTGLSGNFPSSPTIPFIGPLSSIILPSVVSILSAGLTLLHQSIPSHPFRRHSNAIRIRRLSNIHNSHLRQPLPINQSHIRLYHGSRCSYLATNSVSSSKIFPDGFSFHPIKRYPLMGFTSGMSESEIRYP